MYLSELAIGEKKNFLELASYAMGLNGEYKEEEKEVFASFFNECALPSYELSRQSKIDSIVKVLGSSISRVRRIILIELFGILLADNEICDAESEFMDKVSLAFDIQDYELKRIQRWVEAMNDLVDEGFDLLGKE